MTWRDAVLEALFRFAARHQTRHISRQMLLEEELESIVQQTGSVGRTPQYTLSRILQELRDEGILYFSSSGRYLLTDAPIPVDAEDLPTDALDFALAHALLAFPDIPTDDQLSLQRRRVGQARIRSLALQNYRQHCALCDVSDTPMLVASHIVRWSDDAATRGKLTNVICMCRLHDPLFEHGYFSLADDLSVIVKPGIASQSVSLILDRATRFRPPGNFAPEPVYLAQHRARVGLD